MSNIFLNGDHSEIETAILLENAKQCDLKQLDPKFENAVAFTDGKRVFVNSDDQLTKILPAYNEGMLKWLLWHEKYHMELKHHKRFFKYMNEIKEVEDTFKVTKEEVNIIMDILVHDSLSKLFPDLIETARANLAQMRNCNSLGYTFKTHNLEDMLDEYAKFKRGEEPPTRKGPGSKPTEGPDGPTTDGPGGTPSKSKDKPTDDKDKPSDKPSDKKGHSKGGDGGKSPRGKDRDDTEPEVSDGSEPTPPEEPTPEHDKTDWSKLKDVDSTEFINEEEADYLDKRIEKLRQKKFKLARLTETLNGLATTTKTRTYSVPSYMNISKGIILKGKRPGKTPLYLCFDASGSMGSELETFKEIISKSIPHAMDCPCEWFTYEYGKGKFKDIMDVYATSGFDDDGDRTIALCLKAEEQGFSPIGVTDGGGGIYRPEVLKKLKRTILVGPNERWLQKAKQINPHIQILDI